VHAWSWSLGTVAREEFILIAEHPCRLSAIKASNIEVLKFLYIYVIVIPWPGGICLIYMP